MAMAWAAAANKQPVKEQPTIFILPSGQSVAVVDANAIIAGVQLHTLGERLMTIPEVMGEIRDVRSRQAVAFAAVPLVQQDPAEEDVKAGKPLPELFVSKIQQAQQV